MSELKLSIDDFARCYIDPAVEHLAAMTRRELRRRRISRRTFLQMSDEQRQALIQDAMRRYGDAPNR